jgi:hypothetical protein
MGEVVLVFITLLVEKSLALSRCDLKGIVPKVCRPLQKVNSISTSNISSASPSCFFVLRP